MRSCGRGVIIGPVTSGFSSSTNHTSTSPVLWRLLNWWAGDRGYRAGHELFMEYCIYIWHFLAPYRLLSHAMPLMHKIAPYYHPLHKSTLCPGNTYKHIGDPERRHPSDASHRPPDGVLGSLQVVVNQLSVGNLQRQNKEEAVDAVEAWRDVKMTPRRVAIAVLVKESVHHRGPAAGVVLSNGGGMCKYFCRLLLDCSFPLWRINSYHKYYYTLTHFAMHPQNCAPLMTHRVSYV